MTELWSHQADAIPKLIAGHHLLAFAPGTGKTLTALTACKAVGGRHLAIVPANIRTQWERQARAAGLTVQVLRKETDQMRDDVDLTVVSYHGVIRKPLWLQVMSRRYASLTLDESHMVKSPQASMTKAIFGSRPDSRCIYKQAERVWLLTGTPILRDPSDLWVMMSRLFADHLEPLDIRRKSQWIDKFCRYDETPWGLKIHGSRNEALLAEVLKPVMTRVNDSDAHRPAMVIDTIFLEPRKVPLSELTDEARELLEVLVAELDSGGNPDLAGAETILATLRRLIGEAKAPDVAELIEGELLSGRAKIVVFYQHVKVGNIIQVGLRNRGIHSVRVGGDANADAREAMLDEFLHSPDCRVFLGQLQATGTGLDGLQVTDRVFIVEPAWTPGPNEQAFRRVARGGSKHRHVYASYVALSDSIDEAVLKKVASRTKSIKEILDDEPETEAAA